MSSDYKYIEVSEITENLKGKLPEESAYKILSNNELIRISLRKRKPINVYRITHKIISEDTIDINFSTIELKGKRKIYWRNGLKFKQANIQMSCGGTNGYKPDFRFIKNHNTEHWEKLETNELNQR